MKKSCARCTIHEFFLLTMFDSGDKKCTDTNARIHTFLTVAAYSPRAITREWLSCKQKKNEPACSFVRVCFSFLLHFRLYMLAYLLRSCTYSLSRAIALAIECHFWTRSTPEYPLIGYRCITYYHDKSGKTAVGRMFAKKVCLQTFARIVALQFWRN